MLHVGIFKNHKSLFANDAKLYSKQHKREIDIVHQQSTHHYQNRIARDIETNLQQNRWKMLTVKF